MARLTRTLPSLTRSARASPNAPRGIGAPPPRQVQEELERSIRKRRQVGPGSLFPAPKDLRKPVGYELLSKWLEEAERAGGLTSQKRSLWHAYRRLWASSRKDLPDTDVAQSGVWSSLQALKSAYQQPDEATMLRVVTHGVELRDVR